MTVRKPDLPDAPACPHLGLAADRRTHYTFPHPAHRCYAGRRPGAPEPGRQPAFCLTDRFAACDVYQARERKIGSASAPEPPPTATAAPVVPAPPAAGSRMDVVVHVCRPGDTIARIAAAYDLTVEQIATANRLVHPYALADSQRLVIPLERPPAGPTS